MKNQELGRSMMEMMGVLGIIGVLSVGGIAGFSKMMIQQRVNKSVEQVTTIAAKLSQIGAQSGSYGGLDNASALKFEAIPSDMIVDQRNAVLANPFGDDNSVEIEPADLLENEAEHDNMAYTITYKDIPTEACIALASHGWSKGQGGSSFVGIGVGDRNALASIKSELYQDCTGKTDDSLYVVACNEGETLSTPMDPGTAANICSCEGLSSCLRDFVWMFY